MNHRVYVCLGSNVEPARYLPAGLALLRQHGVTAVSRVYETVAVGTADSRPFLNAAVALSTALTPAAFKAEVCRGIESRLGRVRDPADRCAPRTLDLDIALWDDLVLDILGSPVPDPDILRHLHVVLPLVDLAPDLVHPTDGRQLREIARALSLRVDRAQLPVIRTDLAGWSAGGPAGPAS